MTPDTNLLFQPIRHFIFDVDGVLTDGTVLVLDNGLQARRMSIRDGYALQLAVKCGYHVIIVSGSSPSPVVDRLEKLGITEIHMSVLDKRTFVTDLMKRLGLKKEQVLYMGDDIPDLPVMDIVGLPACPADAAQEIKEVVKYISRVNGGEGCVREVIESVMKLNGDWQFHPGVASR